MSDEEKKAIERIKNFGDSISCATYPPEAYIEMKDDIEDILYLIETQQKEISLLKDQLEYVKSEYEETIEQQQKEIEELKNIETYKIAIIDKDKYISKDKIKAKIENFKKVRDTILENEAEYKSPMMTYDLIRNDYCEKMLQELLKEK